MKQDDQGPHVISRVGRVLRAVGAHEPEGASTSSLARAASLARPTAHRILTALAAEGLVDRDPLNGLWFLGPELYLLGKSAAGRYDITQEARDVVHLLAGETGESAFLSARRGGETVCLIREDGSFPLRSHVLYEGIRFPLGVASAGLAIISHLPDPEAEEFLGQADLVPEWGDAHSVERIRERIRSTRSTGYAVNPGLIVEGSWGLGAAVFDRNGRPEWALSLTGVESRFRPERVPKLGRLLLQQAHRLSQRLEPNRASSASFR